ncbi:Myb-like DNA-binding domain containing protein [Tritrichomonas foetus]|uniref:Myb-like DNA-binding domain containing protein n=1 Tax=Tritrichomonas foetus TaxID=1144522 RepID=A0A1J4J6R0_9EUKA|nr:Myb-like DNA-binding domain containing protein [Tritrichomonas foetus]|eukprot:OHS94337.1 Myb-like DNA-binding domain containing protein [Tritrichomonas foetus]
MSDNTFISEQEESENDDIYIDDTNQGEKVGFISTTTSIHFKKKNHIVSSYKKMKRWSVIEDKKLINAIKTYGTGNWSKIAQEVGGKRGKSQCSQRWTRCLNPEISHDKWTVEEDQNLLLLVEKYGLKSWRKIANSMGNRCDVQCRYRYQKIWRNGKYQMTKTKVELPSITSLIELIGTMTPNII